MPIGSRFSAGVGQSPIPGRPEGAESCWGRAYDPDDYDCRHQCTWRASCHGQYRRVHPASGVTVQRGVANQNGVAPHVRHNNPLLSAEERDETPLMAQAVHNMVLGASQTAWDELHDVIARFLGGIFRY